MKHRWMIAAALAAQAMAPLAQTVYESKDKAGPVFSDKPSPGAKPVHAGRAQRRQSAGGCTPRRPRPHLRRRRPIAGW